jgi:hypothetical protein
MSREFRGGAVDKVTTVSEFFASLADLANIQSTVDTQRKAYEPEGVAADIREAREQAAGDFKQACSLIPEHEEKQGLVETAERLFINQLVKLHRRKRLVRQLQFSDMVDNAMSEVRKFLQKNMPKVWIKTSTPSVSTPSVTGGYKQQQSWSGRGGGKPQYDTGRGGGKQRLGPCFTCGGFGHVARDCMLGAQALGSRAVWPQQQWSVSGASTPFQSSMAPVAMVQQQQQQQSGNKVGPQVNKGTSA